MAVSDKYIDSDCEKPWNGQVCPHGIDHAIKQLVCSACLQYAMSGGMV